MSKTFNIYCDESCHLENDHKAFMFLGSVSCAYPQVERHTKRIDELKKAHNFYAEIKWTKVSQSKLCFYLDLLDYFFDTDLKFRAIGIEKSKINNEEHNHQTFDEFYYKMYYKMLGYKVDTLSNYNVYLDIKDTLSACKVRKLREILNVQFDVFRTVQNIHSKESILMQLADFLMGALSYYNNNTEHKNVAKMQIIDRMKKHCDNGDFKIINNNNKDFFF
ncbi:MAG: DUF3800 domain-containing protein, partial [Bacteroidales bacterium]